jgi:hypothetical protein
MKREYISAYSIFKKVRLVPYSYAHIYRQADNFLSRTPAMRERQLLLRNPSSLAAVCWRRMDWFIPHDGLIRSPP